MKTLNALNIYQINIFQTCLNFKKISMAPKVFHDRFKSVQHIYPTKYSLQNSKERISTKGKMFYYFQRTRAGKNHNERIST